MHRIHRITHRDRPVVLIDLTGLTSSGDWASTVAETRAFFAAMPADRSALTLTDVSDTQYNRETIELMKNLTRDNAPYVRVGAVVNRSAMHRAAIGLIALFARRKFEIFPTRDQALDWLVAQ